MILKCYQDILKVSWQLEFCEVPKAGFPVTAKKLHHCAYIIAQDKQNERVQSLSRAMQGRNG